MRLTLGSLEPQGRLFRPFESSFCGYDMEFLRVYSFTRVLIFYPARYVPGLTQSSLEGGAT